MTTGNRCTTSPEDGEQLTTQQSCFRTKATYLQEFLSGLKTLSGTRMPGRVRNPSSWMHTGFTNLLSSPRKIPNKVTLFFAAKSRAQSSALCRHRAARRSPSHHAGATGAPGRTYLVRCCQSPAPRGTAWTHGCRWPSTASSHAAHTFGLHGNRETETNRGTSTRLLLPQHRQLPHRAHVRPAQKQRWTWVCPEKRARTASMGTGRGQLHLLTKRAGRSRAIYSICLLV